MKSSVILDWLSKPRNLWITLFDYMILAGLFVQLILLPYIDPCWQGDNGFSLKDLSYLELVKVREDHS